MNQEALKKAIDGTVDERKFLAEHSFGIFAVYYFSHYFKYPLADYHYDMEQDLHDLIKGNIRECAWIMYRESAKTTFAKLFIIWLVAYKKKKYINVDAFDKENAERILFDVAYEMTNNKRLIADFGALFSKKRGIEEIKQNRINNFVTENGIRVEAHSTQESVRGRIHLEQRPDFLVLDDFETNKTKDSEAYTKQVREHISEAMAGMSPDGSILYLGNYISEYGNIQHLIDRAKHDNGLRIRNVPVIINGEPAWKAKYAMTDEEAKATGKVSIEDKKRQLGSQVFSYEMMNQPIDDSIAEFKREYEQSISFEEVMRMNTRRFITVDTAVSKADSADFTGVTVNYVNNENKWHVKSFRVKYNPKELIEFLFSIWRSVSPESIGIERTIYLQAIKPFLDDEMRLRNTYMLITELQHNQTAKETRIRGLIPRWESRSIYFIENECNDLKEEMRTFPRGIHDDVLDSLAYQQQIANAPYKASYADLVEEQRMRERNTDNYAR